MGQSKGTQLWKYWTEGWTYFLPVQAPSTALMEIASPFHFHNPILRTFWNNMLISKFFKTTTTTVCSQETFNSCMPIVIFPYAINHNIGIKALKCVLIPICLTTALVIIKIIQLMFLSSQWKWVYTGFIIFKVRWVLMHLNTAPSTYLRKWKQKWLRLWS